MSISVNTLILELRRHTGMDINDLPDPDALLFLNRSWWEVMDKFDFREKEQTYSFNTVNGTGSYNVPALFEAMTGLSIEDKNSKQHTVLERMEVADYENSLVNTSDSRGMPSQYYRENNTVNLLAIPDGVYTITMKYLTTLTDLAAGNTPGIPQVWHEIILFGGVYRAFLGAGELQKGSYFRQSQAEMINTTVPTKSKEEVDNRYSGLQMITRRPSDYTTSGKRIN